MPVVDIPDPSLVVLVGAAGSGKSTLAARHFAPDEILSSDALRAAIAGDEADQRATRPAFAALDRALARRLAAGRLTVVDATSVERHARARLLARAREAAVPAVAILLDLPPALVLARNAGRERRVVDPEIVRGHLAALRGAVNRGDFAREGWSLVVHLREPRDVEELQVLRRRVAPTPTPADERGEREERGERDGPRT